MKVFFLILIFAIAGIAQTPAWAEESNISGSTFFQDFGAQSVLLSIEGFGPQLTVANKKVVVDSKGNCQIELADDLVTVSFVLRKPIAEGVFIFDDSTETDRDLLASFFGSYKPSEVAPSSQDAAKARLEISKYDAEKKILQGKVSAEASNPEGNIDGSFSAIFCQKLILK